MDSMRLEKGYKNVGRELSIEYAAFESGLDRFVDLEKGDFRGREALLARRAKGFANALVTLEVLGVTDADARGSEPVFKDGKIVGRTTSGGYGWRVGKSLALAMLAARSRQNGRRTRNRGAGRTAPRAGDRRKSVRPRQRPAQGLTRLWLPLCKRSTKRPSTTSSSARDRRAACSPTASAKTASIACLCWSSAAPTGRSSSRCRRRSRSR